MNFERSDEQAMLHGTVQRFVADRHGNAQRRAWRALPYGFSPENRAMLAELGIPDLPIAAGQGGLGGALADIAVVMEALGCGLAGAPVLIPDILAAPLYLATFGQRRSGRLTLGHGDGEAPARIDDAGRLNGIKRFVPHADAADILLVTCRRENVTTLCALAGDAPGVMREDHQVFDGSHTATVRFDGVAVSADQYLPCPPAAIAPTFRRAAVATSAEMLGIMQRMFVARRDHGRARRQFCAAIASFQAVRHRMAQFLILIEQSRSLVLKAALLSTKDPAWQDAIDMCRLHGGRIATSPIVACSWMAEWASQTNSTSQRGAGVSWRCDAFSPTMAPIR